MARKTLRRLIEKPFGTEWSRLVRTIRRRDARRFLIVWNRGLGDIALGLARVITELREVAPDADITVLTRADLADAFLLTHVDHVLVDPALVRGVEPDVRETLIRLGRLRSAYDLIIERPDPTHWFRGRPGPTPRLSWPSTANELSARFDTLFEIHDGARIDVGVHVQSETCAFYNYRKDWPIEAWQALFERIQERHPVRFVLFGHHADHAFDRIDCVDLRGKTSFLEMMSVIKNRCLMLIAPDSGVLTMTYCLDVETPIDVVSLWADPRQGILKQATASPNPMLRHQPLLAHDERIEHIGVDTVAAAVETMLGKWSERTGVTGDVEYGLIAQ